MENWNPFLIWTNRKISPHTFGAWSRWSGFSLHAGVARLHAEDNFLAAMEAAGEDIARAREAQLAPMVDCALEAEILATPLD
jgi:hypothetical protein